MDLENYEYTGQYVKITPVDLGVLFVPRISTDAARP